MLSNSIRFFLKAQSQKVIVASGSRTGTSTRSSGASLRSNRVKLVVKLGVQYHDLVIAAQQDLREIVRRFHFRRHGLIRQPPDQLRRDQPHGTGRAGADGNSFLRPNLVPHPPVHTLRRRKHVPRLLHGKKTRFVQRHAVFLNDSQIERESSFSSASGVFSPRCSPPPFSAIAPDARICR